MKKPLKISLLVVLCIIFLSSITGCATDSSYIIDQNSQYDAGYTRGYYSTSGKGPQPYATEQDQYLQGVFDGRSKRQSVGPVPYAAPPIIFGY